MDNNASSQRCWYNFNCTFMNNFQRNFHQIQVFSCQKRYLKVSLTKWWPFQSWSHFTKKQLFHCNSNLMEISFCSHPSCSNVIAMKFCTWHNSYAVVACAKFHSDFIYMIPYHGVTLKRKSFMEWAPGLNVLNCLTFPSETGWHQCSVWRKVLLNRIWQQNTLGWPLALLIHNSSHEISIQFLSYYQHPVDKCDFPSNF